MTLVRSISNHTSLHQYVELLVRLHSLIAKGRGDDVEAEDLRELMDDFWYKMSESELQIARQLSADLYLLSPTEEMPFPIGEIYTPELAATLEKAKDQADYLLALKRLRERPGEIGAHRALSLMSICYSHLRLYDVSILFAQRAIEFAEDYSRSNLQLLLAMIRAGKREAGLAQARRLLQNPQNLDPEVRLFCATLFLGESHLHEKEVAGYLLAEALQEFKAILLTLDSQRGAAKTRIEVDCLYFMGEVSYLLGDVNSAVSYLNQAININASDEKSLVLRGMLRLRSDFKNAIRDFSKAISSGTHTFEAYYYVAYDALASERFDDCIHFAQIGLSLTNDAESMAELHEMIAYSLVGKSKSFEELPVDEIRRHFRTAIDLTPFDAKYDQRLQEFESFVSQNAIPARRTMKPTDVTIKGLESRAESYLAPV